MARPNATKRKTQTLRSTATDSKRAKGPAPAPSSRLRKRTGRNDFLPTLEKPYVRRPSPKTKQGTIHERRHLPPCIVPCLYNFNGAITPIPTGTDRRNKRQPRKQNPENKEKPIPGHTRPCCEETVHPSNGTPPHTATPSGKLRPMERRGHKTRNDPTIRQSDRSRTMHSWRSIRSKTVR